MASANNRKQQNVGGGKGKVKTQNHGNNNNNKKQNSCNHGDYLAGVVFKANNDVMKEAEDRMLLGATIENIDVVYRVSPGTRIFILDSIKHNLFAGFEAASKGRKNIEPSAWKDTSSKSLVAQVRIRRCHAFCTPLRKEQYLPILGASMGNDIIASDDQVLVLDSEQTKVLEQLCFQQESIQNEKLENDQLLLQGSKVQDQHQDGVRAKQLQSRDAGNDIDDYNNDIKREKTTGDDHTRNVDNNGSNNLRGEKEDESSAEQLNNRKQKLMKRLSSLSVDSSASDSSDHQEDEQGGNGDEEQEQEREREREEVKTKPSVSMTALCADSGDDASWSGESETCASGSTIATGARDLAIVVEEDHSVSYLETINKAIESFLGEVNHSMNVSQQPKDNVYESFDLTRYSGNDANLLWARVQHIVASMYGSAQVQIYGSFATGLWLPGQSDLDLIVSFQRFVFPRPPIYPQQHQQQPAPGTNPPLHQQLQLQQQQQQQQQATSPTFSPVPAPPSLTKQQAGENATEEKSLSDDSKCSSSSSNSNNNNNSSNATTASSNDNDSNIDDNNNNNNNDNNKGNNNYNNNNHNNNNPGTTNGAGKSKKSKSGKGKSKKNSEKSVATAQRQQQTQTTNLPPMPRYDYMAPPKIERVNIDRNQVLTYLYALYGALKIQPWVSEIKLIRSSSMPVIKMIGSNGMGGPELPIDISFQTEDHHGIQARDFVLQLTEDFPGVLRPLVLVLKRILRSFGLHDVYTGGLGSYSLTTLVAFFLVRCGFVIGSVGSGGNGPNGNQKSNKQPVGPRSLRSNSVPISMTGPYGGIPSPPLSPIHRANTPPLLPLAAQKLPILEPNNIPALFTDETTKNLSEQNVLKLQKAKQAVDVATREVRAYLKQYKDSGSNGPFDIGMLLVGFLQLLSPPSLGGLDLSAVGISILERGRVFIPQQPAALCIEDPVHPTKTVGSSSFQMFLVQRKFAELRDRIMMHPSSLSPLLSMQAELAKMARKNASMPQPPMPRPPQPQPPQQQQQQQQLQPPPPQMPMQPPPMYPGGYPMQMPSYYPMYPYPMMVSPIAAGYPQPPMPFPGFISPGPKRMYQPPMHDPTHNVSNNEASTQTHPRTPTSPSRQQHQP